MLTTRERIPGTSDGAIDRQYPTKIRRKLRAVETQKARKERLYADMRCTCCGVPNERYPLQRCPACEEVIQGRTRLMIKHRMCVSCGEPNDHLPKRRCKICSMAAVESTMSLQYKRKAKGLCVQCGKKNNGKSAWRCPRCQHKIHVYDKKHRPWRFSSNPNRKRRCCRFEGVEVKG